MVMDRVYFEEIINKYYMLGFDLEFLGEEKERLIKEYLEKRFGGGC